jgi:hypothetical protein
MKAKLYSIADASKELPVDRQTLRLWVKSKFIPVPKPGTVKGRLAKCWTEEEMARIRKYYAENYGGKGMDRRKGSRAEQTKVKKAK